MPSVAEALQITLELYRAGRLEDVRTLALRILEAEPRTAAALHLLGLADRRQGRLQEAAQHFRAALAIAPDMADVRCNLGSVLAALGQVDAAAASQRRALALDPALEAAHQGLAGLLASRGGPRDWAAAAASFRRILRLQPDRADICHDLGIALRQDGAVEQAVASQRNALAHAPGSSRRSAMAARRLS